MASYSSIFSSNIFHIDSSMFSSICTANLKICNKFELPIKTEEKKSENIIE